jgi:hypothetical protein
MRKIFYALVMIHLFLATSWAAQSWESQGGFYFLTKDTKESFAATGAGANKFSSKYLTYDGVDFLVKSPDDRQDYGRLNIGNNNMFVVPLRSGMKIAAIHFLASGDFGNSYLHDSLLRLYGENYYYSVLTVTFAYQDGTYKILSAPVFWDWFHLPSVGWTKDGVKSKVVGLNPVRRDCTMYHISFTNPKPNEPVKDILVSDSWVSDQPFSDVFAVTLQSSDTMQAIPKR